MSDDIDLHDLAETERVGKAIAAGELELVPDDSADIPDLPPTDAPVNVIRPVRVPYDLDVEIRQLAEERGTTISAMLRELIVAGLAAVASRQPDPVTELRLGLAAAQRALETLESRGLRNAA